MYPHNNVECPLREIVMEAVRELEETKLKFTEVTEKLKCCENKLNNALNVMLKCVTFPSRSTAQACDDVQNDNIRASNNLIRNGYRQQQSEQETSIEEVIRNIKTEPELKQADSLKSSEACIGMTPSIRKRHYASDVVAGDERMGGELIKHQKIDNCAVVVKTDLENWEPNISTEIVTGSVVPVVGNSDQDDLCSQPQTNVHFSKNESSELVSSCTFSQLPTFLSKRTLDALSSIGFTSMMDVQAKVIPEMLNGRNMVVSSSRGSGKTLAFLIPVIEMLYRLKFQQCDGTGCVILCPSNELVMQTYNVLVELMRFHEQTYGMLLQSHFKELLLSKKEKLALDQGVNILVTTPVKLLVCMAVKMAKFSKLQCVVVDDCDLVFSSGAKTMKRIFMLLHRLAQLALFTADDIPQYGEVKAILGRDELFVTVSNNTTRTTAGLGIEHYYMHCEAAKRTFTIFKIVEKWHKSEKVVVIFKRASQTKYFGYWLPKLGVPVYVMNKRYGSEVQINTFLAFCSAKTGILLCNSVLSVGLDIPGVSWVVHYDWHCVKDYVCGAGLTARGINGKGKSLLLLHPSEHDILHLLQKTGIIVKEHVFTELETGIEVFLKQLQVCINSKNELKNLARKVALQSLVNMRYSSHMPLHQLQHVMEAFGIEDQQQGVLNDYVIGTSKSKEKRKLKKQQFKQKKLCKWEKTN